MKNIKQLNKNKKRGLYFGLGIGLASIVAGSTAGIVISLKHVGEENLDGKVKFIAGSNHTFKESGSSLTINLDAKAQLLSILPKDTLVKLSSTKIAADDFVGWAKTSDFKNGKVSASKVLSANSYVEPATSLTAVFKDSIDGTGQFWKVQFTKGEQKVILSGNTIVNVLDGTHFESINKPGCESEAIGSHQKCIGWKKVNGSQVGDVEPITADTTLEPIMSDAAVLTFKPASGDTEAVIEGTATITAAIGTKFGEVNIPKVDYSKCTGKKIFLGWYKTDGTWAAADEYLPTTQLTKETKDAFARSIDETSTEYVKIHAVQPADVTVTYQGNTDFAIVNGTKWGSYNLPIPVATELKVSKWQWSKNQTTGFADITSEQVFENGATIYIRPVMVTSISSVRVALEKTPYIAPECKTKVYAEVLPKESSQNVTWNIAQDPSGAPIESTLATIDATGTIWISQEYAEQSDTVFVKATSTAAPAISSPWTAVTIKLPTKDNRQYWTFDETESTWYRLENLCHQTADIEYYKLGSLIKAKTVARSNFNSPVFVGELIDTIDNNFLYNCTSFNSPIYNTNVTAIGDNFLFGCSSFDQEGVATFVEPLQSIGNNFMAGCTSYNNEGESSTIYFRNIVTIGDNVLKNCTKFNSTINLGTKLETIGMGFLDGCTAFNNGNSSSPLILPSSITDIGSKFMHMCSSFCSTLQIECAGTVFAGRAEITTLASTKSTDPIRSKGFKVIGNGAASFPFKDLNGIGGYYRKVNVSAETVTDVVIDEESTKSAGVFKTKYNVGEKYSSTGLVLSVTFQKEDGSTETRSVVTGYTTDLEEGHEFAEKEAGESLEIRATYCGLPSNNTTIITVRKEPEKGEVITKEEFDQYYQAAEKTLQDQITSGDDEIPREARMSDLQVEGFENLPDDLVLTVSHPEPTTAGAPSTVTVEDQDGNSAEVNVSLGDKNSVEKLEQELKEKTGEDPTYYHNEETGTTTVSAGTEGTSSYFVAIVGSNGLITKIQNTINGLTGFSKSSYVADYESKPTKTQFINAFNNGYNSYKQSHKTYKTVTFQDGDSVKGEAVTTGNVTYNSKNPEQAVIKTGASTAVDKELANYTYSGIKADTLLTKFDWYVTWHTRGAVSYELSYNEGKGHYTIALLGSWGNSVLDFTYGSDNYLYSVYAKASQTAEEPDINITITKWNE